MTAAPQVFNYVPKRNHLGRYWTSHFVKPKQTTTRILFTTTPAPPYRESHLSTILRPADGRRLICRRASWDSHRYIGLSETSDKLLLIPKTVTAPSKNQGALRSMTDGRGNPLCKTCVLLLNSSCSRASRICWFLLSLSSASSSDNS